LIGCMTVAATLVNPYGHELLVWVWDSVTWPRPEISEWWPVRVLSLEYLSFKVLASLSVLGLLLTRRPRSWSQVAILALAGAEALAHKRHIPLFAILASFWIPEHVNDCWLRVRDWLNRRNALEVSGTGTLRMYRGALAILTIVFALISFIQFQSLRVERATFPVQAFEFIEDRQLEGRMVTEFNWGQYCLYSFWPRILVSVDGRFDTSYSRPVLDINLDFMMGDHVRWRNRSPETGAFQADRVLDLGEPNLVLIDRQRSQCVHAIEQRSDWVLLYQDALAQIWGRRVIYDDPASPKFIPTSERVLGDETQTGWVPYPALPKSRARTALARN